MENCVRRSTLSCIDQKPNVGNNSISLSISVLIDKYLDQRIDATERNEENELFFADVCFMILQRNIFAS